MLKNEPMKKALIQLAILLSFNLIFCQDVETKTNDDYTTIGYFSSKNLISFKGKILKVENYTFLQIVLDEELYTNDYDASNGISFHFDLESENRSLDYNIFTPISNEINNKKMHLILLNENDVEIFKKSKINEIEVSLGYSTTYNFKNIKEPNFFINQLK